MISQVAVECDFGKGTSGDIYCRYGETGRVVHFNFTNSLIGEEVKVDNARFCLVKSDGTFVIQDFDNSVGMDITANMCASSGVGSYEVQIDIDGVVVSGRGNFVVADRVLNDDVIESVSEGNGLVFPDDFQEKLIAGEGIKIEGNVISFDVEVDYASWYRSMKEWKSADIVEGVVEFETLEEGLLGELKVGIEPVQDLHGYDKPWVGGAGKNLAYVNSGNNIVIAKVKGGTTYTFSCNNTGIVGINLKENSNNGNIIATISRSEYLPCIATFTPNNDMNIFLNGFSYISGTSFPDFTNDFQIEVGSIATTFEPYTNICPITGWDSVGIDIKDGDGVSQREYRISLGQTVYGGVLDVTRGELIINKKSVDLGSMAWTLQLFNNRNRYFSASIEGDIKIEESYTNGLISSCFNVNQSPITSALINGTIAKYTNGLIYVVCDEYTTVSEFTNNMNGQTLVYDINTPITIQITPQEILALEGENNLSADSGGVLSCLYSKIARYISARNVVMDSGESVQKAVSDLQ